MRSFGSACAIFATSSTKCSRRARARAWAGPTAPCCCRSARWASECEIWNFTFARNDARLLQPVEHAPGFDRHVGVAGLERPGVGRGAGLDAQARNLAHHLAVPLRELERRHVRRKLDRGVGGEHVLQETDPGLADAGLAVGKTNEVPARPRPTRCGTRSRRPAAGCCRRGARWDAGCDLRSCSSPFAAVAARCRS